jgi:hypothetical protein
MVLHCYCYAIYMYFEWYCAILVVEHHEEI